MPLVLTQNEATESGHSYADVLGVSYEYPRRYRNVIRPGEPFVYYRGRRTAAGGQQPQAYLGTGVVGEVVEAGNGLLVCQVENYEPFVEPLPFKGGDGYLERRAGQFGSRAGLYFRQGVRVVDDETFGRILRAADAMQPEEAPPPDFPTSEYASQAIALEVDDVAMERALTEASARFPHAAVERMPHNNPGYDIRVVDRAGVVARYIEVKGTTRNRPHFFITEGERRFSALHAAKYSLWVFYGMDLETRTALLAERDGEVGPPNTDLSPVQHTGVLAEGSGS